MKQNSSETLTVAQLTNNYPRFMLPERLSTLPQVSVPGQGFIRTKPDGKRKNY
jgi:hypothetical protein